MRRIIVISVIAVLFCACSSSDCPLNNTIYCVYSLKGDVEMLSDTLTVTTPRAYGEDTILIDQKVNISSLLMPMSYIQEKDILYFKLTDENHVVYRDTVIVSKTNDPHFESVDCPPCYFHTITDISHTHNYIDSIIIKKTKVDYDTEVGNLHIYFKPRN